MSSFLHSYLCAKTNILRTHWYHPHSPRLRPAASSISVSVLSLLKFHSILHIRNHHKCKIHIYDPYIAKSSVPRIYQKLLISKIPKNLYECIIIAVKHNDFKKIPLKEIKKYGDKDTILLDLKNIYKNSKDRNLYKI